MSYNNENAISRPKTDFCPFYFYRHSFTLDSTAIVFLMFWGMKARKSQKQVFTVHGMLLIKIAIGFMLAYCTCSTMALLSVNRVIEKSEGV